MQAEAVNTRRVLVVDDHADVLEAMRLLLKGCGYASDLATSPAAAMAHATESDYDVILLDMNYARDTTSGEEGLALLDRLHAARPRTPLIVMTAWSTIELAVAAMQHGARDFITKPWRNERVLELLDRYCAPEAQPHDSIASARRVQQRLLPPARYRSAALECAFVWRPAGEIGGDYCDLLPIDNDRVAFALGDICGKGVPAALLMTSVYAAVRSQIELASEPAAMARSVNRLLCESTAPENYATFFYGVYHRPSRTVRYVNCGHTPGMFYRANGARGKGAIVQLDSTSTVVGLFQNAEYAELTVQAEPGDRLVLFSDGLPDSQPDGDDGWIARSVSMLAAASSASIAESLAAAAVNGSGEIDDVTILDLRFL
jgi:sigma-B regulation protein RsbU (phosphoserine phosphatase)